MLQIATAYVALLQIVAVLTSEWCYSVPAWQLQKIKEVKSDFC